MDREKLLKAWELFRESNPYEICNGREFRAFAEPEYCMGQMIEDTIELLKEQEPVKPKKVKGYVPPMYTHYGYECEKCETSIMVKQPFCMGCGRPVKWE